MKEGSTRLSAEATDPPKIEDVRVENLMTQQRSILSIDGPAFLKSDKLLVTNKGSLASIEAGDSYTPPAQMISPRVWSSNANWHFLTG